MADDSVPGRIAGAVVAVALLTGIVACGQPSGVGASRTPAATEAASPSQAHTPQPSPSPTPLALACRIPVILDGRVLDLSLPGGSVSPDITGQAAYDRTWGPDGGIELSWVRLNAQLGKWIPVGPELVSPDQHSYAYMFRGDEQQAPVSYHLHVASIDGSNDRDLSGLLSEGDMQWHALAWLPTGIYVTRIGGGGEYGSTVYLYDPSTGSRQVVLDSPNVSWETIDHGVAWGRDRPGSDPASPYSLTFPVDRLTSHALASGTETIWFHNPSDVVVGPLGFTAAGLPIIAVYEDQSVKVLYLSSAGTRQEIHSSPMGTPSGDVAGLSYIDGHGTWFGSGDGTLYLFTGQVMGSVAKLAGHLIQPAGDCM